MRSWRSLAILTLLCTPLLAAQTAANWTEASSPTSPPARAGLAMAYDSEHDQVVLFGGSDVSFNLLSDTWAWDGANWSQKTPQTSPSPRESFAMAYRCV